ncbi:MAG: efflux RND transporter permease subunit, partial [Vulcanimicrobiaceae bacterium]
MRLTQFAITRPVIVAMFFIAIAVYGLYSYFTLGVNLFPNISFPFVAVSASYPGASPATIEKLIVKPIEDQLNGMENLEQVNAVAQEGSGVVVARFRLGSDLDYETVDVQRAVDAARVYMPTDLDPPQVSKFTTASDPILEEALSSTQLSPSQLSNIVDNAIVPDLTAVPGIVSVQTAGDTQRELHVYPDPLKLLATGATLDDVFNALAANNQTVPGGRMDAATQETTVLIRADVEQPADLNRIPVPVPGGAQRYLTVGDLAQVEDGHVEQRLPSFYNGAPSVLLYLQRQYDADQLGATTAARAELAKLVKAYPAIHFSEIDASADYTRASVNGVLQSLLEGIVLTSIVMLLFLHAWRNAVVVLIAIPSSLLATFIMMKALGFTVDLISMMGLGLTIGILVDDSIVVLENITRHRDMGEEPLAAAYKGRTEIGQAAIAITLVDVVVFTPIAFLSGIIGEYMREFGLVVVVATLFSLLVSFTLTPLLAGRWSALKRTGEVPRWAAWFQSGFERLAQWYSERALPWCLGHRIVAPLVSLALIVGAVALVPLGYIGSEFVPGTDPGVLDGSLQYAVGQPLGTTQRAALGLSAALKKIPGVDTVLMTIGAKQSGGGYSQTVGGHVAQFHVVIAKNARRQTGRILTEARKLGNLVPGALYEISNEGGSQSGGAPIQLELTGPDGQLQAAATKVAATIARQKGAVDVDSGVQDEAPQLDVNIDWGRASTLGVAPGDAALAARIA